MCPACGADLSVPASSSVSEFIFCEGCGARLNPQDRTCPKCGRPAPGILSQNSAASDLAAGKTASFPRVTSEMIAEPFQLLRVRAFPMCSRSRST